jgi:hypothetical protein
MLIQRTTSQRKYTQWPPPAGAPVRGSCCPGCIRPLRCREMPDELATPGRTSARAT